MKKENSRKVNFDKLYSIMILIGVAMLVLAVLPFSGLFQNSAGKMLLTENLLENILIALGSGIITSTLVAYFIDKNNRKILIENNTRMIRNILVGLYDIIKEYNSNEEESHKLKDFTDIEFLTNILESCEASIPLGIGFYSIEEVLILKKIVYWSKSVIEHFNDNNIIDFYERYEEVFKIVVDFEFKDGPYSEEDKIEKICRDNNLAYSEKIEKVIGESIYLYKKFNVACSEFIEEFSYLNE